MAHKPKDKTPDKYEAAMQAARAAMEAQLKRWGFAPEHKKIWEHLPNNALATVSIGIGFFTRGNQGMLKRTAQEKSDTSALNPDIALAMSKVYQQHYPHVAAALKAIPAPPLDSAFELEPQISLSLQRIGARAALKSLKDKDQETAQGL
jgi:hypothetical protein